MKCQRCNSLRILQIQGKCSDRFAMWMNNREYCGYVPFDIGIGGSDNIEFGYCLECGQIQGQFPVLNPDEYFGEDDEDE